MKSLANEHSSLFYEIFMRCKCSFQMIWAKTKKVGCGVALCNSRTAALVVCKYKDA